MVADESLQVDFSEHVENNFFSWNQNLAKERQVRVPSINPSESLIHHPESFSHHHVPTTRHPEHPTTRHPERSEGSHALGSEDKLLRSLTPFGMTGCGESRMADGWSGIIGGVAIEEKAASDLAASYILFHDSEIHQSYDFLDGFEKIRVISQVDGVYRGAVANILKKVEGDLSQASSSLSLILLKEIFADRVLPNSLMLAAELEKNLSKKVLREIKNLKKKTSDQSAFAKAVENLLEMIENENKEEESKEKEESESENDSPSSNEENSKTKEGNDFTQDQPEEDKSDQEEEPREPEVKDSEIKNDELGDQRSIKAESPDQKEEVIEFKNAYRPYTTKFDEVIFPQKLVSKNELGILRDHLDLKLAKLDSISKKMTLKLKRKLLSKRDLFLEFDSSAGVLDRKKFSQFVTNPLSEDIWINNKNHQYQDTALTILLDNSGSMRGQPIVMSALACEIIAEILEKFSIKTEIIGFTTADWRGGRARKLWESSGRPKNPGRLNELRHIIYKGFNQKFKKAKNNLGLMLKEGILKENIDGEALLFARSRLMQQPEKRKILLVISDGTPVDDSTSSANDNDILTEHLHHVIKKTEKAGKIEIVAIGIGHSTDDFYRNSAAIKSSSELGDAMIEKIVDLL